MKTELESWTRQSFDESDGKPLVFYVLYGTFPENPEVPRSKYKTDGLPVGFNITKLNRNKGEVFPFSDGEFAKISLTKHPELSQTIENAAECLVIKGEVTEPINLNYLRDSIGLVTYFLDNGAVAALDPQQLEWYNRDTWKKKIFEPNPPDFRNHIVILWSHDSGTTKWFHTRGMRKFGRPDLSIHAVENEYEDAVIELFNRFIVFQAEGGSIYEGQEITISSLPLGMICHHKGNLDDPDFNNTHVEIRWPSSK